MMTLKVNDMETYDESRNVFTTLKGMTIKLEHSLVSLSKWESKCNKPFLSSERKSVEEIVYYIKCMTITQNVPDYIYDMLTNDNIEEVSNYISQKMTATTFNSFGNNEQSNNIMTSEIIYYCMISYGIPFECQKWHLNRLITLIKVCNAKNNNTKMSRKEIMNRNKILNQQRRKLYNSKG